MTAVTFPNTRAKLLAAGRSSWTMPTTREGIDKRLEAIAAGKGGHKPTTAHPYERCFTGRKHSHGINADQSCEEFIRAAEQCAHTAPRRHSWPSGWTCTACGKGNLSAHLEQRATA